MTTTWSPGWIGGTEAQAKPATPASIRAAAGQMAASLRAGIAPWPDPAAARWHVALAMLVRSSTISTLHAQEVTGGQFPIGKLLRYQTDREMKFAHEAQFRE
ncbi:hypothetical protein [Novosphingobium sp. AAP1]|uniref:hypothetical protein n=1 Tax=Novosphingobium sp. AAP1 TaxID=1523413 RepID=UPI0018D1860A|nr:hypothetical protein [Novosphingobium sp. AAP1]